MTYWSLPPTVVVQTMLCNLSTNLLLLNMFLFCMKIIIAELVNWIVDDTSRSLLIHFWEVGWDQQYDHLSWWLELPDSRTPNCNSWFGWCGWGGEANMMFELTCVWASVRVTAALLFYCKLCLSMKCLPQPIQCAFYKKLCVPLGNNGKGSTLNWRISVCLPGCWTMPDSFLAEE